MDPRDARPDLFVRGADGRIRAAVRVRDRRGTAPSWAAGQRRAARQAGAGAPFFLVATPDRLYLWTEDAPDDAPPAVVARATDLLEPFLERMRTTGGEVSRPQLALAVEWWLERLAAGDPEFLADAAPVVGAAPFLAMLRGATVELAPVVG